MDLNRIYKYFVLLLFVSSSILSQKPTGDLKQAIVKDAEHFIEFGRDLAKAPINFDETDLTFLTSGLAIVGASSFLDAEIRNIALKNQNKFGKNLIEFDDYHGNFYSLIPPAVLYTYGLTFSDEKTRNVGLKTIESFFYSGLIVFGLKILTGRERPYVNGDVYKFQPMDGSFRYRSFPSGHSTISFAVSFSMAHLYENFYWKGAWYTMGALTSISRVYNDKHWFSDVLMGAGIGYAVSSFNFSTEKSGQKFTFYTSFDRVGIIFRL